MVTDTTTDFERNAFEQILRIESKLDTFCGEVVCDDEGTVMGLCDWKKGHKQKGHSVKTRFGRYVEAP